MKIALVTIFSFCAFLLSAQSPTIKVRRSDKSKKVDQFMSAISKSGQFMGAVLVAEKGRVIYKKGFGFAKNLKHWTRAMVMQPK